MAVYEDRAKLLWSLAGSGLGTAISAAGNSGGYGDTPPAPFPSSAISCGMCADIQLLINVGGVTSTPTFKVQVGYYDSQGHLFQPTGLATANITAAGQTILNAGSRGGAAGTYFIFTEFMQVSWTCSGGSVTGVQIELWGR